MIDVIWYGGRGYWDQGWLERIFDRTMWRPASPHEFRHWMGFADVPDDVDGAVVVVAARWFANRVDELNVLLDTLDWCVVVLTGDEENAFPHRDLKHSNMAVWVQTPDPVLHADGVVPVGDFWPPDAPAVLAEIGDIARRRSWFFAGQVVDHPRRMECAAVLAGMYDGDLIATPGFGQGLPYRDYLEGLASAKIAPCPAGPFTPDTFRVFEALEAGCLPVVDRTAANRPDVDDYWRFLFGREAPFPVVDLWDDLPGLMPHLLRAWPQNANRAGAWWQAYKRDFAYRFEGELSRFAGSAGEGYVDDSITVLIPTSPIPSHPSTTVIEDTVASVRHQLPLAEIIVMCDGVRAEQDDRRDPYAEYVRRLLWLCEHRWTNVVPYVHDEHLHQANLTRHALAQVRTPLVMFVEHDTPIVGDVDWQACLDAILGHDETSRGELLHSRDVNLIRFYHETAVHPEHSHLMIDDPTVVRGAPLLRTAQWSQRPHLASTAFYREIIATYFGIESRTMIEDAMHGIVDHAWREYGIEGWERFKLWLYAPDGNIQRSTHSDGRAGDPKYDMLFRYDGERPEGAPAPTRGE